MTMMLDGQLLPDISQIDPDHIEQIENILAQRTAHAATDAEALEIAHEIYNSLLNGMVWDEEGLEQQVLTGGADDWSPEQIEAQALVSSGADLEKKKRDAILWGVIMLVVLVGGVYMIFLRGDKAKESVVEEGENGGVVTEVEILDVTEPGVAERIEILELGGDLGGDVRLGVPRTLELLPDGAETSSTLAVLVAPIGTEGVIPIADQIRDGEELVTEWIQGTFVNFSFGVSARVIDDMKAGGRAIIRTTSGANYSFLCEPSRVYAPQETETIFSQSRPGATLFPLPSPEERVNVIWCVYDPTNEEVDLVTNVVSLSEMAEIGNIHMSVQSVSVDERPDGQIDYHVRGTLQTTSGVETVLVNLDSTAGRYSPLGDEFMATDNKAEWLAEFVLPPSFVGSVVNLDVRNPIRGESASFLLGEIPNPRNGLRAHINERDLVWDMGSGEVEVIVKVSNEGDGTARLTTEDFNAYHQGGANVQIRFIDFMPVLIPQGQTVDITIRLLPASGTGTLFIQILNGLWEIQGFS